MTDKKVLILGAGRIGLKTAEELAHKGYTVTLQNRESERNSSVVEAVASINAESAAAGGSIKFVEGWDDEALSGHSLIFHTAGATRTLSNAQRGDLTEQNAFAVGNSVSAAALNPEAPIVNITNPPSLVVQISEKLKEKALSNKVFAAGVNLDTWRLNNAVLPALLNAKESIRDAYVVSEHGEGQVLALDKATCGGKNVMERLDELGVPREVVETLVKKYSMLRRAMGVSDFRVPGSEKGDFEHPAEGLVEIADAVVGGKNTRIPLQTPLSLADNYGFSEWKGADVGVKAVGHLFEFEGGDFNIVPPDQYLSPRELSFFNSVVAGQSRSAGGTGIGNLKTSAFSAPQI